jgi:16S rRNA (guanine(966)-N(2))-methyltransferase RsmD
LRIISGKYKGRYFNKIKNLDARPTTDKAKEALFNILANRVFFEDIAVLDLFAGTGSISYEFASRGCTDITCVDINYNHIKFIKKTSAELKLDLNIIKADVFKFVKNINRKFDIVFADPPFDLKDFENIPATILDAGILKPEGILIIEHSNKFKFETIISDEERRYGKVCFSFFENTKNKNK